MLQRAEPLSQCVEVDSSDSGGGDCDCMVLKDQTIPETTMAEGVYVECTVGTASKFWRCTVDGSSTAVAFGKRLAVSSLLLIKSLVY